MTSVKIGDAFGMLLTAGLEQDGVLEVIERDDGFVAASPCAPYFAPFRSWPPHQRRSMRYVRGRVLDVGCGAGRVTLHLEERGHEVVAIDASAEAIEVCSKRGVKDARIMRLADVGRSSNDLGIFDTILLLGGNFGLLESARRAPALLRQLLRLSTPTTRIIAESLDPYHTDDPYHLAYHRRNRDRGRMSGQIRLRVRHRDYATRWFDYLFVSRGEMQQLVANGGWRVERFVPEEAPVYIAVLEPANRSH
jgi:SAM-dependent methyltransferase